MRLITHVRTDRSGVVTALMLDDGEIVNRLAAVAGIEAGEIYVARTMGLALDVRVGPPGERDNALKRLTTRPDGLLPNELGLLPSF